jgi:hypothetical protein
MAREYLFVPIFGPSQNFSDSRLVFIILVKGASLCWIMTKNTSSHFQTLMAGNIG